MLDDNFNRLTREFPNCWKPFGNGMRACIGRPFAWQEALLVMAMLLQNFDFEHVDPDYKLGIKQTLTIKPKDFFMTAKLRGNMSPTQLERRLAGIEAPIGGKPLSASNGDAGAGTGLPLTILYGSNTGTCEALAQRLAADAASHGFHASTVDSMDSGFEALPTDRPIVIITASYEGQPPDNAGRFVSWMDGLNEEQSPLKDLTYAVFGCGNHEWAQTFHRIPKLVDTTFERAGASRVAEIGLADAANGDIFTSFETWEDEILWPALAERYSVAADSMGRAAPVDATVSTPRLLTLRQDLQEAIVVDAWDLSTGEESVKRHIEIRLPEGMSYQPGDYLAVLPVNPKENVHRAMRRFGLARDAHITITAKGQTSLPSNESVSAYDILSSYIELAQPATKRVCSPSAPRNRSANPKSPEHPLASRSSARRAHQSRTQPPRHRGLHRRNQRQNRLRARPPRALSVRDPLARLIPLNDAAHASPTIVSSPTQTPPREQTLSNM